MVDMVDVAERRDRFIKALLELRYLAESCGGSVVQIDVDERFWYEISQMLSFLGINNTGEDHIEYPYPKCQQVLGIYVHVVRPPQ